MFTTADTGDMMSTLDVMTDATGLDVCAGMTISVRSRRDVVVVDPDRFLAAARLAMQDLDPSLTSAQAATAVTDVGDAVFALLDRDGDLAPATTPTSDDKGGARIPGTPVADRADGLAPAGALRQIVLDDLCTLRDYGCFLPDDPFALPARSLATIQESEPPAIGRGAHPDPDTARQPTATAPPGTPEPVVARLQAAALAAICALTDPYAGPIDGYPNPHTSDLAPYDLTSLFCFEPSGTRCGDVASDLEDVATLVSQTADGAQRRSRALWIVTELRRLGHATDADRFTHLAE
jgi:hypothetical protein